MCPSGQGSQVLQRLQAKQDLSLRIEMRLRALAHFVTNQAYLKESLGDTTLGGLASTQTQVSRPVFADSILWLSNIFYMFTPSLPCPMSKHTLSQHLNGERGSTDISKAG